MSFTCSEDGNLGETVELFISALIATVSFSLYALEIRLIARQPNFQHPFFFQFILLAVSKMILWLSQFISMRFIPHPFFCDLFYPKFSDTSTILKPLLYGYYIPLTIQLLTIIVICISRMTVVSSPINAPKVWARYSYRTLAAIIISACLFWFFLADWNAYIILMDFGQNHRLFLVFADGWPYIPLPLIIALLCVLTLIIVIGTTTVTLAKLYRSNGSQAKAEVNLFWTSVCFAFTTILIAFYTIMSTIYYYMLYNQRMIIITLSLKGWIFDLNCCLPAWLLLFTNKQIKKQLLGTNNNSPLITTISHKVPSR